jgi:putative transposase
MRRARLTYDGAFHHCVNRGHGRERILAGDKDKTVFLNLLNETSKRMKIRVLAFCLMDNHYHLVIENSSGRMADFFKLLNGEYGTYYRRRHGGNGYVFQGRYSHTIVTLDGFSCSQNC